MAGQHQRKDEVIITDGTDDAEKATVANGRLQVDVISGPGGGDGAIQDGANAAIEATVFDYTNSNPLSVRLSDTNGDYVSVGGGTQYAEDTGHVSGDIGTMALVVRKDTGAAIAGNDGDYSPLQVDASGNLRVNIAAGSSAGTEYTDGDADATPTGSVILGFDGANVRAVTTDAAGDLQVDVSTLPAITGTVTADTELNAYDFDTLGGTDLQAVVGLVVPGPGGGQLISGTSSNGLQVDLGVNNDVTVTGSVTANAGTNLNTSALALETGGNLAAAAASLNIVDDWDETDRCKVNPIAGQAGVQGGSGVVTALTQRVVLATDVALPAGTNGIGKLTANSGVDIGDVDVLTCGTITPGTAATNLGKAEDAGHSTGDVGVMSLGVRVDVPNAAASSTTADYQYVAQDMVGGVRMALYETDFAVLGTNHVKKYYTSAGAVTDGVVWDPAAGKRWYVTDIFINVSAAATVTLEDNLTAGDAVVWKAELAANSGWTHSFHTPLFSGEDGVELLITTTAGNVYVMVTGYEV